MADTKRWHAQRPTHLSGARVHCGTEDRHDQVEAVARYAQRVAQAVDVPRVRAVVVVHGSPVVGVLFEADTVYGPVTVLGADSLVDWLRPYGLAGGWDREAAVRLAVRAAQLFPEYQQRAA